MKPHWPVVLVAGHTPDLGPGARAPRPLAGRSVVVTRPRHQAGELVAALEAAGAEVVSLPVIDIAEPHDGGAALERALAGVAGYDWVVFTSANAVHRTLARLRDVRGLGTARVAAVGRTTAAALAGYGVRADLVPSRSDAAGLTEAFPNAVVSGARVLFPAAAGARPVLAEGVAAKGWCVDTVEAYRTVAADPPAPAVLGALGAADAVTFASPSSVDAYLAMRVGDRPLPVPPAVACIGPVTAAAARAAGLSVDVAAASPSPSSLVEALARWFGRTAAP